MTAEPTSRSALTTPLWSPREWFDPALAASAVSAAGEVEASLRVAVDVAETLTQPGDTWAVLRGLATLGATDLTTARIVEPHVDALTILAEAGSPDLGALDHQGLDVGDAASWGVYAAGGPLATLRPTDDAHLSGTKPWCSLADHVSHALVTAGPQLYAVSLRGPWARTDGDWSPRGLTAVTSTTLHLADAPAVPVGAPGFYLSRPGFWVGAVRVAAVWFGGAAAVAGRLLAAAGQRPPDQVTLAAIGRCDRALYAALLSLRDAAAQCDAALPEGSTAAPSTAPSAAAPTSTTAQGPTPVPMHLVAARCRAVVADAVDTVLHTVGHTLGPGPLVEEEHARRVADLTLYVRQHHAERDLAAIGSLLVPDAGAAR